MVLRSIWIEEQYMGVKKIVMLAILVSFVAGCAPL
ncbi:tolA family protein, partial [Escherichia coli]|nr:tolA family protein [Escherichia coli]